VFGAVRISGAVSRCATVGVTVAIALAACGDGPSDDSSSIDPNDSAPTSTTTTLPSPDSVATTAPATSTTTTVAETTTTTMPPTTTTTLAPTTTAAPVPVDPLLIPPGTIEDGTHVGYLVSQSPGWLVFDRADVNADGSWSNVNPKVRSLPIAEALFLPDGSPIRVVVQNQHVVDAGPTTQGGAPAPTAAPAPAPGPGPADPGGTPYVVPTPESGASWADEHSSYPATDIFVPSNCGGDVLSPVNGVLLEVRTTNSWDPAVDNPATRGGRSISILGDDGVRYYLAHFSAIDPPLAVGDRVGAGQRLGQVGDSGRTSACHIHFGISPPCPDKEWSVRRGVVWPYTYLDAWRDGVQLSPAAEVAQWSAANPTACADAARDPFAPDS
jgi:murein DD-endopeptidase MepM/ murein hydrolase activator NlpD